MDTMTLKNIPRADRILTKRENYFDGIDNWTDEKIELASIKWHRIINRYTIWLAKIELKSLENKYGKIN